MPSGCPVLHYWYGKEGFTGGVSSLLPPGGKCAQNFSHRISGQIRQRTPLSRGALHHTEADNCLDSLGGTMTNTLNRRKFLRGSAVAGAAVLATPAIAANHATTLKMQAASGVIVKSGSLSAACVKW